MGRNFANKLWNAARLVLLATEGATARAHRRPPGRPLDREPLPALRSTPSRAPSPPTTSSAAVDTLYHFVWDEFCDWYLEMVKPRLYGDDEAERRAAAGHARWVLDGIVRLLHPFLPFVTEEIAAQYGAAPLLARRAPAPRRRPAGARGRGRRRRACRRPSTPCASTAPRAASPRGTVLEARFVADEAGAEEAYRSYAPAFRAWQGRARAVAVGGSGATEGAAAERTGRGDRRATCVLRARRARFEVAARRGRPMREEAARLAAQLAKLEGEVARCDGEARQRRLRREGAAGGRRQGARASSPATGRADEVAARLAAAARRVRGRGVAAASGWGLWAAARDD